jgi:hypothetical protein
MDVALLERIVASVKAAHDFSGILIYGSRASTQSAPHSDVDLICISPHHQNSHLIMTCDQLAVDIYASTRSLLEESIRRDSRTNNNFVLDAFAHGRMLDGDDGILTLCNLARDIWRAGPRPPSPAERQATSMVVQKALASSRRLAEKSKQSKEWESIAELKLGYLFQELVYAYCRVHRLWASSLWEMLTWTNPLYQDLLALCRKYLGTSCIDTRILAIDRLVQLILCKG